MENPSPKHQAWVQSIRESSPPLNIYTVLVVIATICITTRIISGKQSVVRQQDLGQARDVRKLPHWIPYIGHAISLGLGSLDFLLKTRKSLGNEPVFGLHMGGRTHNMVTTPSLMHSLFLQRTATSLDGFIGYIMVNVFGYPKEVRDMDPKFTKSLHSSLNLLMRDPCLSNMISTTVKRIERESPNLVSFAPSIIDQTPWERVSQVTVSKDNPDVCEANLFALLRNFVGNIATTALMGQAFMDMYPNILEDLWTFDRQFNLLMLGIPPWFPLPRLSAAYAARERLTRAMASFHAAFASNEAGQDPGFDWRDMDDVSEVMQERARGWIKTGFHPKATAPGDVAVMWAMNVNANMAVYWLLLHILSDPKLFEEVSEEIAPFAKASRRDSSDFPFPEPPTLSLDIDGLTNSCPVFKAAYYETLRLDSSAFSYKEVVADFTIPESDEDAALRNGEPQTFTLRKDEYVCIPHGMHHLDPNHFPDPKKFDPRRFLVEEDNKPTDENEERGPEEKISHGSTRGLTADMGTIRPFGGGSTACKGRLFAEKEILAFVAGVLVMWDIQPADRKPWKLPGRLPASAVALPNKELRVKLKLRV